MTEMTSCQNESDSPWRPPGEIHRTPNPERKHMEVSYNRGAPKWMVFKENHIKMDDLGLPCFRKPPYNKSHQWTQHHLEHIYFNPCASRNQRFHQRFVIFNQVIHGWITTYLVSVTNFEPNILGSLHIPTQCLQRTCEKAHALHALQTEYLEHREGGEPSLPGLHWEHLPKWSTFWILLNQTRRKPLIQCGMLKWSPRDKVNIKKKCSPKKKILIAKNAILLNNPKN